MKMRAFMTLLLAAVLAVACNDPLPVREPSQEKYSRVLIYVGDGYNTICNYIADDIKDIVGAPSNALLPAEGSNKALIIISHLPKVKGDWATPTEPIITRVSRDYAGRPVCDTLMRMPSGTIMTKSENFRTALEFVRDNFPADSYGMILSSHGSGWLPAGYLNGDRQGTTLCAAGQAPEGAVRYVERPAPYGIDLKTFGQELKSIDGVIWSYEMTLPSLAASLPFNLDYMIIDACLMGCVETAYELRGKVRHLCISPAEILGDGFDYATILSRLLVETPANVKGVCEDYYNMYESKTGVSQSATITMVDCSKMDHLAECCHELFSKYRSQIANVEGGDVQGFFRENMHWFYDLKDILVKAGITYEEQVELTAALDECMVYRAHTKQFMNDFEIKTYCGFSMYLPSDGDSYLNSYYTELEWNKATGLVE